jgi:hypothetical protein
MPRITIGVGDLNKAKLLLTDIHAALKKSTNTTLARIRQHNGIAIGYNRQNPANPSIEIHSSKMTIGYPFQADVLIYVMSKGNGGPEQMNDLLDAVGAVYDELVATSANRRTTNNWCIVNDQVPADPIEDIVSASSREIVKGYRIRIRYEWGGAYTA